MFSGAGDDGMVRFWPNALKLTAVDAASPPTTARRLRLNVISTSRSSQLFRGRYFTSVSRLRHSLWPEHRTVFRGQATISPSPSRVPTLHLWPLRRAPI